MKEVKLLLIAGLFSLTLTASDNYTHLKEQLAQCSTADDYKLVAMQQLAAIQTLEYLNGQLVETNDKLVKVVAESNQLLRESQQSLEKFSGSVWLNQFRLMQLLQQGKVINTAIRLIDVGITLGVSMQLYQWYGMH